MNGLDLRLLLSSQVSLNPAYQVKEVEFVLKKVQPSASVVSQCVSLPTVHSQILTMLLNQSKIQKHVSLDN